MELAGTQDGVIGEEAMMEQRKMEDEEKSAKKGARGIFDGVVVYVNGSTYPLVSDHKLKHVLVENGAQMSLHLGRRRVTHIIVGRPVSAGSGAGGGLAASKIEKEIKRIGGCGVKFVTVEWYVSSAHGVFSKLSSLMQKQSLTTDCSFKIGYSRVSGLASAYRKRASRR